MQENKINFINPTPYQCRCHMRDLFGHPNPDAICIDKLTNTF